MSSSLDENEEYQTDTSQDTGIIDPNPWNFSTSKNYCTYQIISSFLFIYIFLMFDFFSAFTVFIIYIFFSAIYYRTKLKISSSQPSVEPSYIQ